MVRKALASNRRPSCSARRAISAASRRRLVRVDTVSDSEPRARSISVFWRRSSAARAGWPSWTASSASRSKAAKSAGSAAMRRSSAAVPTRDPRAARPARPPASGPGPGSTLRRAECFIASCASATRFVATAQSSRARQTGTSVGTPPQAGVEPPRRLVERADADRQVGFPQPDSIVLGMPTARPDRERSGSPRPGRDSVGARCAPEPG